MQQNKLKIGFSIFFVAAAESRIVMKEESRAAKVKQKSHPFVRILKSTLYQNIMQFKKSVKTHNFIKKGEGNKYYQLFQTFITLKQNN